MGDTEKRTDALTPTGGDWAHTISKGALSAIPAVGGPAAELLAAIIVPPLARRRDEWIRALADGLHVLEARVEGFTIAGLAENEAFVSTVMQATTVAVRTHQQEKREALRNAVLNVAAGRAPDRIDRACSSVGRTPPDGRLVGEASSVSSFRHTLPDVGIDSAPHGT